MFGPPSCSCRSAAYCGFGFSTATGWNSLFSCLNIELTSLSGLVFPQIGRLFSSSASILPAARCVLIHTDVDHRSWRLNQDIFIMATPLYIPAHLTSCNSIDGVIILNGIAACKNMGKHILCMVDNCIRIHAMEMILQIWKRKHTHTQRV